MTLSSEPSTATDPSSLPGDPAAYRKRGGTAAVWAVVAGVFVWTLLCIAGTVVVLNKGAVLKLPQPQTAAPPARAAETPDPALSVLPVEPAPEPAPASAEVAALSARLQRVESDQRRVTEAAAAALAAASLAEAAKGSQPFGDEVMAIGRMLPASTDLRALQRVAQAGAPTIAALAAEFSDLAAPAAVAARAPAQGSGFFARAAHALAAVFTIRRVDHARGDSPDAILARAEALIADGDLEAALAELDRLPAGGKETLAAWRAKAERRLEIDERVSAIRAAALRDLSLAGGG